MKVELEQDKIKRLTTRPQFSEDGVHYNPKKHVLIAYPRFCFACPYQNTKTPNSRTEAYYEVDLRNQHSNKTASQRIYLCKKHAKPYTEKRKLLVQKRVGRKWD